MALRSRLRRAFTRSSPDDSGSLSKTSDKSPKKTSKGDSNKTAKKSSKGDSDVYQPGEKMPPLKYRRPVDPIHKANLEAFTWTKAWRRKSAQSMYSPMGSRMPSRKNSRASFGRRSMSSMKGSSRGDDIGMVDSGVGGSIAGDEMRANDLREGSDEEGDITNVGLSRPPSNHHKSSINARQSHSITSASFPPLPGPTDHTRRSQSTSKSKPDQPFTPEDLELALHRSHLGPTQEEPDRSREQSPGTRA
ncbi:hypothetical protein BDV95DRAFT_592279 [Massariosphaeria phaeospora]|uniref:Uncharacterized protein n=1 Tax=Massariosphaeria phaeospora TaxID=100035 RepID=A0A7C8MC72_9PLEO|nr:hypothetical protein BDV95DRAFT_592279 [Massariosphaeria phaeospora]